MHRSVYLILPVIAILAGATTTVRVQAQQDNCPQLTSDSYTNSLLCKANHVASQMNPNGRSENVKDTNWNPPSTTQDISNICARQSNAAGIADIPSHCIALFNNCASDHLNIWECYALNFVGFGVQIPIQVSNNLQAKLNQANSNGERALGGFNNAIGPCGLLHCP